MIRRLVVAACLFAAEAGAREPVTLEELQTLASQKAWAELLERAEGLPAPQRTDAWRALVTDAAAADVEALPPDDKEPFAASRRARALGQRYAFLSKAPRFATARDQGARKDLQRCLGLDRRGCIDTFLELTPDMGPEAALQAAHLVKQGHFAYVAMPLFAMAVGGGRDVSACKDAALAEAVIAALGLPKEDPRAVQASKVAFEGCWSALGPKLKAATVGASSYFLANTCQPMRARKALTELQDELCKDEAL
ncbi:hypothetical protein OV207_20875 [Corallococcus sp. BB11-1]|uniref:hypothetical protein n=1 Tax=Corallococcus sp. BB11-1 TaxID=2996783 RepID=UPI00226FC435|nr:hypothetical protein [Corallococcus sp. BB11-1]MCY1033920.1 hypothetical protein [Corallococcus sp. BB11-1]